MGAATLSHLSWDLAEYERRNIVWWLEVRCSVKRGFFKRLIELDCS